MHVFKFFDCFAAHLFRGIAECCRQAGNDSFCAASCFSLALSDRTQHVNSFPAHAFGRVVEHPGEGGGRGCSEFIEEIEELPFHRAGFIG